MPRMRITGFFIALIAVLVLRAWHPVPIALAGQLPLAPGLDRGRTVTPAYEGWYHNPDGTMTMSFGYYNRNFAETVEVPAGPNNRVEPGGPDRGQPTHFLPRRHTGVFTVVVPKDFGTREVTWTLVVNGQTLSVPGHLKEEWMIDAISGDANGNKPPVIKFAANGPTGQGPRGVSATPMVVTRPGAANITVYATDDGVGSRIEAALAQVRGDAPAPAPRAAAPRRAQPREQPLGLSWVKHSGPGAVTFSDPKPKLDGLDVTSTVSATFSEPGDYVLRVHATDSSGEDGSNQCCWTNGYVKVTVK